MSGEGSQQQELGVSEDRQIESWILQQYANTSLHRPLTRPDLIALETRARAGRKGPDLEPALWEDFKDWFIKTIRALKQVLENVVTMLPRQLIHTRINPAFQSSCCCSKCRYSKSYASAQFEEEWRQSNPHCICSLLADCL